jgi:glycine dehydrogenase subunit 1
MLATVGAESVDALFAHVPEGLRQRARVALPAGLTEPELRRRFQELAATNDASDPSAVFMGAGAYPHDVPVVVDHVMQRSEFATAYTPYQAEVSQGTLQSIYEFQTFVALLTGMEVANASMYDGASAVAEAVLMARRLRPKRRTVLLSRALHPHYRAVIATYVQGLEDVRLVEVPFAADGRVDDEALERELGADVMCVVVGYPNVFGVIEAVEAIAARAHDAGAVTITATPEALAFGLLRPPGTRGVDIAVAEGQSFGLPLSFGGPGVGLFATRQEHVRAMPGRVVGETVDAAGARGFVLTLATREQHIRRERATSNICTNQGLCALAVTVYLSLLGRRGLARLASRNVAQSHRVAAALGQRGRARRFSGEFFNEFVVEAPDVAGRWEALCRETGIVPGFPLGRWYPELEGTLLVCVTEVHAERHVSGLLDLFDARGERGMSERRRA